VQDIFKPLFILILWIAASLGLFYLGTRFLSFPESHAFIAVVVAIGVFAFIHRPFYRLRFSPTYDLSIIIFSACILVIYLGAVFVIPNMDEDNALSVCGAQTKEKRCYSLPTLVCQNMWDKYTNECTKEIKINLGDRVTALIGPAVRSCVQKRFDKSLYYTRKTKDPECESYFRALN
jgi:hypothetical protein